MFLQLLGKAHLAQALEVSQLRDGLVVFDTAEAAENYGTLLEEEGHSQVSCSLSIVQLPAGVPPPALHAYEGTLVSFS